MSTWMAYTWSEFDSADLPWNPKTEEPVMPMRGPRDSERRFAADDTDAVFDQSHTYFTHLSRPWGRYPAGARVLISPKRIAIEDAEIPLAC